MSERMQVPLEAEHNLWLTASKERSISVPQPHGLNSANNLSELECGAFSRASRKACSPGMY